MDGWMGDALTTEMVRTKGQRGQEEEKNGVKGIWLQ